MTFGSTLLPRLVGETAGRFKYFRLNQRTLPKPRQIFLITSHAHKQGLFLRWKGFVFQCRSGSVITTKNFGHSTKTYQAKIKCVICGEDHSHKGCPNREKSNQSVLIVKDHMLLTTKGVQFIKSRCSVNMWWATKSYASILKQNLALPPQPKGDTFSFSADQLIKFVATVPYQLLSHRCPTQMPQKTQLTKSQVYADKFPKQLKAK